jgi:hypothetical protein
VRVTISEPIAADRAATLTASLHRAAVDVVSLVDPSSRRHLRAVLRGLREPAVVVVAVGSPAARRRPLVPATLECGDDVSPEELLRAVLRRLSAEVPPARPRASRRPLDPVKAAHRTRESGRGG